MGARAACAATCLTQRLRLPACAFCRALRCCDDTASRGVTALPLACALANAPFLWLAAMCEAPVTAPSRSRKPEKVVASLPCNCAGVAPCSLPPVPFAVAGAVGLPDSVQGAGAAALPFSTFTSGLRLAVRDASPPNVKAALLDAVAAARRELDAVRNVLPSRHGCDPLCSLHRAGRSGVSQHSHCVL